MKLVLVSCCAPCSAGAIKQLHDGAVPGVDDFVVMFFNPNIFPAAEYQKRMAEQIRYCDALGVRHVELEYDHDAWRRAVRGLESEPERGARCSRCFEFRFARAAAWARENGYDAIASVLGVSRHKDQAQVDRAAIAAIAAATPRHVADLTPPPNGGGNSAVPRCVAPHAANSGGIFQEQRCTPAGRQGNYQVQSCISVANHQGVARHTAIGGGIFKEQNCVFAGGDYPVSTVVCHENNNALSEGGYPRIPPARAGGDGVGHRGAAKKHARRYTNFALQQSKQLKRNMTDAERLLWHYLRGRRDFSFRKQAPIGNYIVDFVCISRKLVIELDGARHGDADNRAHDTVRDAFLWRSGYTVLRFWNDEVFNKMDAVLDAIYSGLTRQIPPARAGGDGVGHRGVANKPIKYLPIKWDEALRLQIGRASDFYRQNYCGCEFSIRTVKTSTPDTIQTK